MSARHRDGVHVGYPNSLIQPVDTLGFATPGPNLWQDSDRGNEKTFGPHTPCKRKGKPQKLFIGHGKKRCPTANLLASDPPVDNPEGPGKNCTIKESRTYLCIFPAGPAAYELPTPESPGKSIGQKLCLDIDPRYPAPNAYTLPDTAAATPGRTFGIKKDIDTGNREFPLHLATISAIFIFRPTLPTSKHVFPPSAPVCEPLFQLSPIPNIIR